MIKINLILHSWITSIQHLKFMLSNFGLQPSSFKHEIIIHEKYKNKEITKHGNEQDMKKEIKQERKGLTTFKACFRAYVVALIHKFLC